MCQIRVVVCILDNLIWDSGISNHMLEVVWQSLQVNYQNFFDNYKVVGSDMDILCINDQYNC
jgi:hypothetical protein